MACVIIIIFMMIIGVLALYDCVNNAKAAALRWRAHKLRIEAMGFSSGKREVAEAKAEELEELTKMWRSA